VCALVGIASCWCSRQTNAVGDRIEEKYGENLLLKKGITLFEMKELGSAKSKLHCLLFIADAIAKPNQIIHSLDFSLLLNA
jgi:hypothetical protein